MAPGSRRFLGVGAVTSSLPGKGSRDACGMNQGQKEPSSVRQGFQKTARILS